MLERKQYRKPPLVEVFCEFYFAPAEGQEWDSLLLSQFYDRLGRAAFPKRRRLSSIGLFAGIGRPEGPQVQQMGPPTPRIQFLSPDDSTIVQIGENVLVVNQLPPYYGWEKFEAQVARSLDIYLTTWGPKSITRALLHYEDRVDIPVDKPGKAVSLQDYFCLFPVLPAEMHHGPVVNVAMAFEVGGGREGDALVSRFLHEASANPDIISFRFFWDYVTKVPLDARMDVIREWLAAAHEATGRAFRSALTPRCESLFDPE
jgi:uncharacterized protein (TIGR04255 family)